MDSDLVPPIYQPFRPFGDPKTQGFGWFRWDSLCHESLFEFFFLRKNQKVKGFSFAVKPFTLPTKLGSWFGAK